MRDVITQEIASTQLGPIIVLVELGAKRQALQHVTQISHLHMYN